MHPPQRWCLATCRRQGAEQEARCRPPWRSPLGWMGRWPGATAPRRRAPYRLGCPTAPGSPAARCRPPLRLRSACRREAASNQCWQCSAPSPTKPRSGPARWAKAGAVPRRGRRISLRAGAPAAGSALVAGARLVVVGSPQDLSSHPPASTRARCPSRVLAVHVRGWRPLRGLR